MKQFSLLILLLLSFSLSFANIQNGDFEFFDMNTNKPQDWQLSGNVKMSGDAHSGFKSIELLEYESSVNQNLGSIGGQYSTLSFAAKSPKRGYINVWLGNSKAELRLSPAWKEYRLIFPAAAGKLRVENGSNIPVLIDKCEISGNEPFYSDFYVFNQKMPGQTYLQSGITPGNLNLLKDLVNGETGADGFIINFEMQDMVRFDFTKLELLKDYEHVEIMINIRLDNAPVLHSTIAWEEPGIYINRFYKKARDYGVDGLMIELPEHMGMYRGMPGKTRLAEIEQSGWVLGESLPKIPVLIKYSGVMNDALHRFLHGLCGAMGSRAYVINPDSDYLYGLNESMASRDAVRGRLNIRNVVFEIIPSSVPGLLSLENQAAVFRTLTTKYLIINIPHSQLKTTVSKYGIQLRDRKTVKIKM